MEYLFRLLGGNGEEYKFPMKPTEMIGVTADKRNIKSTAEYWVFSLTDGTTTIETYEDVTFDRLMTYSNFFKGENIILDLKSYESGTIQNFLLNAGTQSGEFLQIDNGFKIVIQEDMVIAGVIALTYKDEIGLDDTVIHTGGLDGGKTNETNMIVECSQFANGIDIRQNRYASKLEYVLDGETIELANGTLGFDYKTDTIGERGQYLTFLTKDNSSKIMLEDVANAINGLDSTLQRMLLDEALGEPV